jgi:acyl-CoA thioester hydrolase
MPETKPISIRWADLDPNFHMRHSAYYDFGAQCRIDILEEYGLTLKMMQMLGVGPILFREECIFKREIKLGDEIHIVTKVSKMRKDASRWTIEHQFIGKDDLVHAIITIDGAWIDTKLRKIANPTPQPIIDALSAFPKTAEFVIV